MKLTIALFFALSGLGWAQNTSISQAQNVLFSSGADSWWVTTEQAATPPSSNYEIQGNALQAVPLPNSVDIELRDYTVVTFYDPATVCAKVYGVWQCITPKDGTTRSKEQP